MLNPYPIASTTNFYKLVKMAAINLGADVGICTHDMSRTHPIQTACALTDEVIPFMYRNIIVNLVIPEGCNATAASIITEAKRLAALNDIVLDDIHEYSGAIRGFAISDSLERVNRVERR